MVEVDRAPGIRPRPTPARRLDMLARRSFPVASTVGLMLLGNAPLGVPDQAVMLPAVAVSSVFFWSLFRPTSMPPPAVFVVGLLLDLLGWLPVGAGALTLLLVHGLCLRWRRVLVRQGFLMIWIAFMGFAAGAAALIWAIAALLTFRLLPLETAIFQAVLTTALYPALAILFARAHRAVADPARA